jgi:PDZ domain
MASDILQSAGLPINYGAIVPSVAPGSPADVAGIRGISQNQTTGHYMLGDIIKGIDGVTVKSSDDLFNYLNSKSVGDTVNLQVIGSNGIIRDTSVTLTEMPSTFENSLTSGNTTSINNGGNVTLTQNSTSNGASAASWNSYTNSTYGISLLYPPNWIPIPVGQPNGTNNTIFDIMHFAPPISEDPAADTTFEVGIDNTTRKTTPTLDEYVHTWINNYRTAANVTEFKVTSASTNNVTIGGYPGYLLYYTEQLRSDPSPRTYLEAGTIAQNKIYYIVINSDLSELQFRTLLLPQAIQMIKSFQIISPNTSSSTQQSPLLSSNVQSHNNNGTNYLFVKKWGSYGTADGQFNGSSSVALDLQEMCM